MHKRKLKPLTVTPEQVQRACESKNTYYSQKEADDAALMVRVRSNENKNVYAYKCKHCPDYHLGHQF